MPFQALPIALRANTGTPVTKLALIFLISRCGVSAGIFRYPVCTFHIARMATFCQCTNEEARAAIAHLQRLERCYLVETDDHNNVTIEVTLPVSEDDVSERKRISATKDQKTKLLEEASFLCALCGVKYDPNRPDFHVDHIIPRSLGGADVEENCQIICGTCNARKGAKVHWVDFIGDRR